MLPSRASFAASDYYSGIDFGATNNDLKVKIYCGSFLYSIIIIIPLCNFVTLVTIAKPD